MNLSYESLTSREARKLLFERVSTDKEFYKSLQRSDEGDEDEDEDQDQEDGDESGNGKIVCYDGVDSSKTIHEAIAEIIEQVPADHLADIYADKEDRQSSESDAEDRGVGTNLDNYIEHEFSTCDATQRWMEWDSK